MTPFRVVAAGDSALVVEFEERIDPAINAEVVAVARRLSDAPVAGVRDLVPAYRALTVYFDPLSTDYQELTRRIEEAVSAPPDTASAQGERVRIPVCYGGEFGPDLEEVAAFGRMSPAEVIGLHTSTTYRVFMLGFVPGFAYMGRVDDRIAMPRRDTPRVRVAAGSVGIAASQTGIYPMEAPGGWRIVGRTPIRTFDERLTPPCRFKAGDAAEFFEIDRQEFDRFDESAQR